MRYRLGVVCTVFHWLAGMNALGVDIYLQGMYKHWSLQARRPTASWNSRTVVIARVFAKFTSEGDIVKTQERAAPVQWIHKTRFSVFLVVDWVRKALYLVFVYYAEPWNGRVRNQWDKLDKAAADYSSHGDLLTNIMRAHRALGASKWSLKYDMHKTYPIDTRVCFFNCCDHLQCEGDPPGNNFSYIIKQQTPLTLGLEPWTKELMSHVLY